MDLTQIVILLSVTLVAGLAMLALRLPPLVGFLAAGFILNSVGYIAPSELQPLSDIGVTLLLFTIGLTFDVRVITRREVWATASIHLLLSTLVGMGLVGLVTIVVSTLTTSLPKIALIGFALSFSSTVLCVKVMADRQDERTLYGQAAVAILLCQDVAAVVFMAMAKGHPTLKSLLIIPVILPVAWLARLVMNKVTRGELMVLFGIGVALVPGWWAFEQVGLKGDLGALLMGLLLGTHPRAIELWRQLMSIKDILLVGFFVSIGFYGLPDAVDAGVALFLVLFLIPLKTWGYGRLFIAFGLRRRTSAMAALTMSNLSEFGIIVAAVGVEAGLFEKRWLVIIALAVAIGMVVSTLLNMREANTLAFLKRFLPENPPERIVPHDRPIDLSEPHSLVLGMGRIGRAAYDQLELSGQAVWGVESNEVRSRQLIELGYRVLEEDATDGEFWRRVRSEATVDLVLLAMPKHESNLLALRKLNESQFDGHVAAVVRHKEEEAELRHMGVQTLFNLYDGAGILLARRGLEEIGLVGEE